MTPDWLFISALPPTPSGAPAHGLSTLAIMLLFSGGALLVFWGALRLRDRAAKRATGLGARVDAPARPLRSMFQRRSRPDASNLVAVARDVEELAERLAAHMDERAERLERLIELADERLALLERATGAAPTKAPRSPNGPTTVRAAIGRAALADAATPVPEPKRFVATAGAYAPDPINGKVYELADLGKEPAEIAAALDEHIGKVQLILALREA